MVFVQQIKYQIFIQIIGIQLQINYCRLYIIGQQMIDQQSDINIAQLRSLSGSFCSQNCLGFKKVHNSASIGSSSNITYKNKLLPVIDSEQTYLNSGQQYYKALFSSDLFVKSLQKHNQRLQIKSFNKIYDSQPEENEVYQGRKKRVSNLNRQQTQQFAQFHNMQIKDVGKFKALISFMKIFADVKYKLQNIRNDYYSSKTFNALNNCSEQQLLQASKIVRIIYESIFSLPAFQSKSIVNGVDERLIQFMIIPRFLISREKISKFINDQVIQQNFKFLIYTGCLGHYNNQANKKFPETNYMNMIRELLKRKNGKQKYKRLCSINHGGKFRTANRSAYFELFKKSLQCLNEFDKNLKILNKKNKGKKDKIKISQISKQVNQLDDDQQIDKNNSIKIQNMLEFKQNPPLKIQESIEDDVSDFIASECKFRDNLIMTRAGSRNMALNMEKICKSRIKKSISMPIKGNDNSNLGHFKRAITLLTPVQPIKQNQDEYQSYD